jgi:hypothetical protein
VVRAIIHLPRDATGLGHSISQVADDAHDAFFMFDNRSWRAIARVIGVEDPDHRPLVLAGEQHLDVSGEGRALERPLVLEFGGVIALAEGFVEA